MKEESTCIFVRRPLNYHICRSSVYSVKVGFYAFFASPARR